jgi:hypothetical protein
MTERAEALASKFELAHNAVVSTVEGLSDDQWKATCEEEGWPVNVTAHHTAAGYPLLAGLIQGLAAGADIPTLTLNQIDEGNANHAEQFANTTKDETLQALREGGPDAAATVRGLTDEGLDRSKVVLQGMPEMTTEQAVEALLIGSTAGHLESIKKAI